MQITKDEELALLVALDKRISPALKDAKGDAKLALMDAYEVDGTDRRAVRVGGEKVGEVGISYTKSAPYIIPGQEAEAIAALKELGLTEEVPIKGWEKDFDLVGHQIIHKPTGEVARWAGWSPKAPKTAVVRGCAPEDVLKAMGDRLAGADVVGLLEDGETI